MNASRLSRSRLRIDPDLRVASRKYVFAQLRIMRKYEALAEMRFSDIRDLIRRCAVYPQQVRNAGLGKTKPLTARA